MIINEKSNLNFGNMLRIKDVANINSGKSLPKEFETETGNFVYGANGIINYSSHFNINEEKIILGRVGSCGEANIAKEKSWISDNALIVNVKKNKILNKFIYYYFKVFPFNTIISKTAHPLLTGGVVKNIFLDIPNMKEQEAIAHFLDDKVGDITASIHTIDDQIKNFEEYKIAYLKKSFSNLKAESDRVKNLLKISKGISTETSSEFSDGMLPVLSLEFLRKGITQYSFVINKEKIAVENDILIVWDGHASGEILKSKKGILSSTIAKLVPKNKSLNNQYLLYALKEQENKIIELSNGMGIPHVDRHVLNSIEIKIPEIDKQKKLAFEIESVFQNIDNLVKDLKKQKQNLIDYKKVLINDVVTGKIKVC